MGYEMKKRQGKKISYCVFMLLWLLVTPVSGAPSSPDRMTKDLKSVDEFQVEQIERNLVGKGEKLSRLKQDLYHIYTSMTSFQAQERFELLRCQENMAHTQGVYNYVTDRLQQLLLMKNDRMPYYAYLEEAGIEEMKTSVKQHLANIERARAYIKDKSALSLLDKAIETIGSSLDLLDRLTEVFRGHKKLEEVRAKTDTRNMRYLLHRYLSVPI
jgi:hypothetical protein